MNRRLINTITSAMLLLGLGFVIAISSRSLPGEDDQETLADLTIDVPKWVGTAFQWAALALAAALATFLVWSLRRGGGWDWSILKKVFRRSGVILLWAVLAYLIWTRQQSVLRDTPDGSGQLPPLDPPEEVIEVGPSVAGSWVAVALLILIAVAALIRLGLVVQSSRKTQEDTDEPEAAQAVSDEIAEPLAMVASTDPRSRVINAYAQFELGAMKAGLGRRVSETARHHAKRAGAEIGAEPVDIDSLEQQYERARFAELPIDQAAAEEAESAWERVKRRIRR